MARLTIYAPDDQAKMASAFRAAMAKMAVIGQNTAKLIDCSDVIPVPKPVVGKPHLPAGKSMKDIEQAVSPTFLEPKAYTTYLCLRIAVRNFAFPHHRRGSGWASLSLVQAFSI
jgi:hypothetical protein